MSPGGYGRIAFLTGKESVEDTLVSNDWCPTTYASEIESMSNRKSHPEDVISLYDEYLQTCHPRSHPSTVIDILLSLTKDRNFEKQCLELCWKCILRCVHETTNG